MPPQEKSVKELKNKVQYQVDRNDRLAGEMERIAKLIEYANDVDAPAEIVDHLQESFNALNKSGNEMNKAFTLLQEEVSDDEEAED